MLTKKENDILEAIEDAIKKQVLATQSLNTLSDCDTLDCMARILERICRIKTAYKNTKHDPEAEQFTIKREVIT